MPRLLDDHRVFWRQFRRQFHTTGAILPSGRFLGRALARFVDPIAGVDQAAAMQSAPRHILEVGPGTGAVTAHIVRRLSPSDRLDLVELNDEFVRRLKERFASEDALSGAADRTRILHERIESLPSDARYDVIVSGLPLNNFSAAEVEQILGVLVRLLAPGGTLSFFEYIAIRPARTLVSGPAERARLRDIGRALAGLLGPHEIRRDCVWCNIPPAWVHHVRLGGKQG